MQLPEPAELEDILAKEAKRSIAKGKENKHYASFELFIEWMKLIGLPTEKLESKLTWQESILLSNEIQSYVVSETLKSIESGDARTHDLMRQITSYLGENDEVQQSNLIFVFGSGNLGRIKTAVNLYKNKLAPKIFISGGAPVYKKFQESEAQVFHNYAIEHGVPVNAIFLHNNAITVADNVRGGLNILDSLNVPYESMILVTSWFAMRRSWAMMMKYVEEGTKLYRVNAELPEDSFFSVDRWYKNEQGIKMIFREFGNLKISEALNSS